MMKVRLRAADSLMVLTCLLALLPTHAHEGWTCESEGGHVCGWSVSGASQVGEGSRAPPTSHTHVLSLQAADAGAGDRDGVTGKAASPVFLPSRLCKLNMYHWVRGATSTLRVHQVEASSGRVLRKMSILGTDAPTPFWTHKQIHLSSTVPFFVLLKGEVEAGGNVVVNNLTLNAHCQPHPSPPLTHCSDDQYSCFFADVCIPETKVCDFTVDCPQGDDESSCIATDFENGLSGWFDAGYNDTTYLFQWVMAKDAPYPYGTALDYDHTYLNGTGHFMWAPGSSSDNTQATAIQQSTVVGPVIVPCTIVFWYQRIGTNPDLRLVLNSESDSYIFQAYAPVNLNLNWKRFEYPIGSYDERIYMKFISNWHKEDGVYNDVCVDDIELRWCDPKTPPFTEDLRCTFDTPCRLFQSHDDDTDWQISFSTSHPEGPWRRE